MSDVKFTYDEARAASREYFNGDDLAAKVFLDKYALRDYEQNLLEKTPEDMHRRIAKEFARVEAKKFEKPLTEAEIFAYFDRFAKIVPQGSPMYGIGNGFQYISLSNCFVVESPADSYSGICKIDEELVQISKRRGGVGVDVSNFRPAGAITHNAARTSTGIIPLMTRYSNSIREVGQNGRRGAEMQSISIHHPESVKLLPDGVEPKDIVVNKGTDREICTTTEFYDPTNLDFASVKYDITQITGANISIRLTDEFLTAVDAGTDFEQRWPVESSTPSIRKRLDAKRAWKKIVKSAWQMAEPGLLFWDNILKESPADCYAALGFKTISTNPCGEIPLSAYDSCRLLLLNLYGFVKNPYTKDAYFDYKEFYEVVQVAQRLMDDLIDLEIEAIEGIINKIKADPEGVEIKTRELGLWENILKACLDGRRTGTGITALGDALAALGVGYGTDQGIDTTERIYQTLKFGAYRSSVDMAKELGAFRVWDYELEKNNPFLLRIKDELISLSPSTTIDCLRDQELVFGASLYADMKKYGRRNIALLTTAPAGTVSIETRTTSGIEPLFMIAYKRRKKGNPGDTNFREDFKDQNGDSWQEFAVFHPRVWDWAAVNGVEEELRKAVDDNDDATIERITKKSPWYGSCAGEIVWTQRVKLQAAAQKHVDHSISSTLNLPFDATVEQVDEIYRTAWKAGCKGVTIYRDGCRSGVLVKETKIVPVKKGIQKTIAPERPESLPCDVSHIKAKGEEYFVIVGLLDGDEPYEVFAGKNGMINKAVQTGVITKKARGKYDCTFDDGSELKNIADHLTDEEEAVTRAISMALRHGADISFAVHQLQKTKGNLFGFSKAMARALSKYIPDEEKAREHDTGEVCKCGGKVIRQDGCQKCVACGDSKCN